MRAIERTLAGEQLDPETEGAVAGSIGIERVRRLRAASGATDTQLGAALFEARQTGFPADLPDRSLLVATSWLALRFTCERSVVDSVGMPARLALLRDGELSFEEVLADLGSGGDPDMLGELLGGGDDLLVKEIEEMDLPSTARAAAMDAAVDAVVAQIAHDHPELVGEKKPAEPTAAEPTREDAIVNEAVEALNEGKTSRGRALLERVLRTDPEHARARLAFAESLVEEDPGRVRGLLEGRDDAASLFLLGRASAEQHRHAEAEEAYRRSLRAPQGTWERAKTYVYLGASLRELRRPVELFRAMQHAVAHYPSTAMRFQLALAAAASGDPVLALSLHGRLLRDDPESIPNLAGMVACKLAMGEVDAALRDADIYCDRTIGGGGHVFARHARARVYLAAGRPKDALSDCTTVLDAIKDDMTSLGLRARAHALLNEPEKAARDLRAMRETAAWKSPSVKDDTSPFPSDAEACALLASCLVRVAAERRERGDERGAGNRLDEAAELVSACGDRGTEIRAAVEAERARAVV